MTSSTPVSKKSPLISLPGIFGTIKPPPGVDKYIKPGQEPGAGLFLFLSNLIKLFAVVAGLAMLLQFIMAGYDYINAGGDAKRLEVAWAKIWQSLIGIIIIASAFILTAVVERFTGLDILNFKLYGPR